jgi:hypothetical protein
MSADSFPQTPGDRHRPSAIDADELLACIPDESSDGLSRDDILRSYGTGRSTLPREEDFDAALERLESNGQVRTTTRRRSGTRVRFYLRTAR